MVSDFEKNTVRPCSTSLETLLRDATITQRNEIERAASEHADAVETIASRVLNDPEIHNPIACFLSKLRNGAHRERRPRTDGMNERKNIEIPWDPALAVANAERARSLLQRLTGKHQPILPTSIEIHPGDEASGDPDPRYIATFPAPLEDDDIPGYGDAA